MVDYLVPVILLILGTAVTTFGLVYVGLCRFLEDTGEDA